MTLEQLRDYREWVGKSPADVLAAVLSRSNGWDDVFSTGLPRWAHRLRNYFNETPARLLRLNSKAADRASMRVKKFELAVDCARALKAKREYDDRVARMFVRDLKQCPAGSANTPIPKFSDEMAHVHALSGDVYTDDSLRIWFQMSPGGAIYHFGSHPKRETAEAISAWLNGQALCPVFKLVSPDGTGGSRECIIKNPQVRKSVGTEKEGEKTIGDGKKFVDVSRLIVTEPKWQGSYNYSETVEKGYVKHHQSDVATHEKAGTASYINPAADSTLSTRRFPASFSGKDLAAQVAFP